MGRRALPKIDPTLDLSRHFFEEAQLPTPLDGPALFGRRAPLEIEVGSGKGLFLNTASGQNPDHDFLGCEVARKYARFAAAKLARSGRTNAISVHGDAIRLFGEILAERSAVAVHVYFPDPWWKARHHKRRIMTEPFIAAIGRVLRRGGRLHFWSDVREYFDRTLAMVGENPTFEGPFEVAVRPAEHDLDYRTHFERRMRQNGEPVYRSEFERID
jgi:tRNA (guanine-N7-)-methyltransferase